MRALRVNVNWRAITTPIVSKNVDDRGVRQETGEDWRMRGPSKCERIVIRVNPELRSDARNAHDSRSGRARVAEVTANITRLCRLRWEQLLPRVRPDGLGALKFRGMSSVTTRITSTATGLNSDVREWSSISGIFIERSRSAAGHIPVA
jgi:hypothetical protein